MMKSDVLDGFEKIKACVAYKKNGEEIDYFPYDIDAGSPRACEKIGVPDAVRLYLVSERCDNVILSFDVLEHIGTEFSV